MTNKERLEALLGFSPANDLAIDGVLVDAGVQGSDTYSAENLDSLKLPLLMLLRMIYSTPDVTNADGQTIKYDRPTLKARISDLESELGLTTKERPTITSKSMW